MVPTLHMSDSGTKKAHKKFKEGQKVAGRVLAVDPAARRLTMTLKPALLGSKLPPITCLQVGSGERAYGWYRRGAVPGCRGWCCAGAAGARLPRLHDLLMSVAI